MLKNIVIGGVRTPSALNYLVIFTYFLVRIDVSSMTSYIHTVYILHFVCVGVSSLVVSLHTVSGNLKLLFVI